LTTGRIVLYYDYQTKGDLQMKYTYDGYWFDTFEDAKQAVIDCNPYKDGIALGNEFAKIEAYSEEKLARLDLNTKEG
jgi:hypothetical protein